VGVLCLVLIANLQYGWTLFMQPMHAAHDRSLAGWWYAVFVITAVTNSTVVLLALLVLRPLRFA
jgi:uncharacterized membrane protein YhaH (DUF805 family)